MLLRYPSWATSGVKVKINGSAQRVKTRPGSYIRLERKWQKGDVVELSLPMSIKMTPTKDDPKIATIAYGPILLAGELGKEGLKENAPYADDQDDLNQLALPETLKTILNTGGKKLTELIKPANEKSPLTFKLEDASKEKITLIPYFQIHGERYVVYWKLN